MTRRYSGNGIYDYKGGAGAATVVIPEGAFLGKASAFATAPGATVQIVRVDNGVTVGGDIIPITPNIQFTIDAEKCLPSELDLFTHVPSLSVVFTGTDSHLVEFFYS